MKLIVVGALGRPKGLRGEQYAVAFNRDSAVWERGAELLLIAPAAAGADEAVVEVAAEALNLVTLERIGRGAKGRMTLLIEGVACREDAEALVGYRLAIPAEALEQPGDDDEFWLVEMPGWSVVTVAGELVGEVVAAQQTNIELLEVRPAKGGETFYVPMIGDVVVRLERAARRVVIEPVEGLLP